MEESLRKRKLLLKSGNNFIEFVFSKTRDEETSELKNNFKKISDKLENLQVEHRALKFENREAEKRLRQMEAAKETGSEVKSGQ